MNRSKILAAIILMGVILCTAPGIAEEEYTLRGLRKIIPPTDVLDCLEFEIGIWPYVMDDGCSSPVLQYGGHGFSFIGANIWWQHFPGGKGGPWSLGLNSGTKYLDVMIKKRFLNDYLILGIGYQYKDLGYPQRWVYLVGLRWHSVSINWRPDSYQPMISIGLEVR